MNSVFWVSTVSLFVLVIVGVLFPDAFATAAGHAFNFTTYAFGWLFLLSVFLFVLFCLYLAFSKFGRIKLGSDDSKPDFSFFTWIGMLFSAGFGIGLVFWGIAEPMSHFLIPPSATVEPQTADAARMAMRYAFFHWGVSQWSVFTLVGLAMAYYQFRKKQSLLISTSLVPLSGRQGSGFWRKFIDTLAVIATAMGVATSLGLGILQIGGGFKYVFGIPNNTLLQVGIMAVLLVAYLASSTTGLQKGIKWLSNINLGLALLLMLFVFIAGPTVFILESFTLGLGEYIQRFVEMSLRLTPYQGGHWVRDWTIFYWAWSIAWSPFVGAFIARVSRGRTIRQFVLGVLIVPPVIALFWTAVFGGTALNFDLFHQTGIATAVAQDITSALFITYEQLPFTLVLSLLSLLLIFTFLVTSADSATFILGVMTTDGDLNPSMRVKIVWGVLMAAISVVLLFSSGLEGLQTASLVSALPFTIILLLMGVALWKSLHKEPIAKKRKDKNRK